MLPLITATMRAGTDPELRFSPGGLAICKFRAVASSRKKDANGDWQDDKTTWCNVTGFGPLAENMAESIVKGNLYTIEGRLHVEDWESGEKKGTSVSILVDEIGTNLKYATAVPVKVEKSGGQGGSQPPRQQSQGSQGGSPWPTQDDDPPF